jgi:rhomboid protease GluP
MRGRQPIVTYALIACNVAVYGLMMLQGGPDHEGVLRRFGALSPALVQQGQWWRLLMSIFLHASVAHILFNMTSLFAVGTLAERLYGSAKFLGIYLGAGLVGSVASVGYGFLSGNADVLGVGASGAIFGVAGALLTVRFHRSDVIPPRLRQRISSSMLPLVLLSLVFARVMAANVDNSAHVGGLLGGMALSFLLPLTRRVPASLAGSAGGGPSPMMDR